MNRLQPSTEVLYSYLTGLAPIGNCIEIDRAVVAKDTGYKNSGAFHHRITELIQAGLVRRHLLGTRGSTGLIEVLVHYEKYEEAARKSERDRTARKQEEFYEEARKRIALRREAEAASRPRARLIPYAGKGGFDQWA